jgi:hypothetical protein
VNALSFETMWATFRMELLANLMTVWPRANNLTSEQEAFAKAILHVMIMTFNKMRTELENENCDEKN